MTETISHSLIGDITGTVTDGVTQFLAVKYATISDRLAESRLIWEYASGTKLDATKLGPQAISSPKGCDMEQMIIQQALPHSDFEISELDPLHININVPKGNFKDLPVFVWIHGGGMSSGSNAWPQYNLARLVKVSLDIQQPIIAIGVNYRLGVPGFLTSKKLRERGYKANNGLRDQRAALLWIQKYIQGFGGDPANVTLAGESAGGACTLLQLQSRIPLFRRAINMSGTPFLKESLDASVAEATYNEVLSALGGSDLPDEEQVKLLLETPAENLWSKIGPSIPLFPVLDHDFINEDPTFNLLREGSASSIAAVVPGRKWCEEILIGDCQLDAHVLAFALKPRMPEVTSSFIQAITRTLSTYPNAANKVLQAYEIDASLPDTDNMRKILTFASDIGFYAPAVSWARAWSPSAFLYHVNVPNPWDGPGKGDCTHMFDVTLLFQNYVEKLPEQQREVGKKMAEDFVTFINGKKPFDHYLKENPGAMVYGLPEQGGAGFVRSWDAQDFGRRRMLGVLQKDGVPLEALIQALRVFIG